MSEPGVVSADDMRQQHDGDLQAVMDDLGAPNPHGTAMSLPDALTDDGAFGYGTGYGGEQGL